MRPHRARAAHPGTRRPADDARVSTVRFLNPHPQRAGVFVKDDRVDGLALLLSGAVFYPHFLLSTTIPVPSSISALPTNST